MVVGPSAAGGGPSDGPGGGCGCGCGCGLLPINEGKRVDNRLFSSSSGGGGGATSPSWCTSFSSERSTPPPPSSTSANDGPASARMARSTSLTILLLLGWLRREVYSSASPITLFNWMVRRSIWMTVEGRWWADICSNGGRRLSLLTTQEKKCLLKEQPR